MPILTPRPTETEPRVLKAHERRIRDLERPRVVAPSTTLPTNPYVGERAVVPHATGVWEVVWTGTAWAYVGGSDLVAFTAASVSTASSSYPATAQGPTVTLPRTGTYDVWIEAMHQHSHTGVLFTAAAAQTGAATTAFGERAPVISNGVVLVQGWWASGQAGVNLAAGPLGISFRAPNSINCTYSNRLIRVLPRTLV